MPTTVRSLGPEERNDLGALLSAIHVHTEGCGKCQNAIGAYDVAQGAGLCAVGAELYGRWADWLEGMGGPQSG